jgi:hypothetical protein
VKGGSGSVCDSDLALDQPMLVKSEPVSPLIQKISAFGGADSSGGVRVRNYSGYQVYDLETKILLGNFTSSIYLGADPLTTVYASGFRPNRKYQVVLTSLDNCGREGTSNLNIDYSTVTVDTETNSPVLDSDLQISLLSSIPYLQVKAHDDSAIDKVIFSIDGVELKVIDTTIRIAIWLSATTPEPLAPLGFSFQYPRAFIGKGRTVTVKIIDMFGNITTSEKVLDLPSY